MLRSIAIRPWTKRWSLCLAAIAYLGAEPAAQAWGQNGHILVARIAEKHLAPHTRGELTRLLAGRTLGDVASWADDFREPHPETSHWHFVDIPLSAVGYDAARDCPNGECVVAALEVQLGKLKDATTPELERRRALRFVVHFVGDLHQPLHAATNDQAPGGTDHGGNQLKARLALSDAEFPYHSSAGGNLHAIWDVDLIDSAHRDQGTYVAELLKLPESIAKMQRGNFVDWAIESHVVARDFAYKLLPAPNPTSGVVELGEAYATACRPLVELQLQRAGVRLARVLNEALASH